LELKKKYGKQHQNPMSTGHVYLGIIYCNGPELFFESCFFLGTKNAELQADLNYIN
jgi:hypothetical protein